MLPNFALTEFRQYDFQFCDSVELRSSDNTSSSFSIWWNYGVPTIRFPVLRFGGIAEFRQYELQFCDLVELRSSDNTISSFAILWNYGVPTIQVPVFRFCGITEFRQNKFQFCDLVELRSSDKTSERDCSIPWVCSLTKAKGGLFSRLKRLERKALRRQPVRLEKKNAENFFLFTYS
jgi:hypothetical protein